jgi:carbon-monoxide dehydrogenase small subunit
MKITFTLNGAPATIDVPPMVRLLDALREHLGLTGTKEGCGEGECGTCTVLLDGEAVNACMVVIGQCNGRDVVTVEGLTMPSGKKPAELGASLPLEALASAFVTDGGAQCGICTPGMLIASEALLRRKPNPTDDEIREAIAGNLCRCTGYQRIVESIRKAAEMRRGEAS